ncbi:MAG: purine-nucleoside phosphorylase [Aggregatilineales bacterium]
MTRTELESAATVIRARTSLAPTIGLILGSGLGALADNIEDAVRINGADVPGWPRSTVEGHKGQIVIGRLEGQAVCALQGRSHFYEGHTMQQSTFPVRVMQALGVRTLIVTNAAGGLNPAFAAGDLMLIEDQINLLGMAGLNPLIGPNDPALGDRFPGMVGAYDRELRALTKHVAATEEIQLRDGVYVSLSGPSYETPAEIRMLRRWGGDAVGMSTAPEVIVARHARMRVLGFSGISNVCIDTNETTLQATHAEVMDVGERLVVPALTRLLRGVLKALNK